MPDGEQGIVRANRTEAQSVTAVMAHHAAHLRHAGLIASGLDPAPDAARVFGSPFPGAVRYSHSRGLLRPQNHAPGLPVTAGPFVLWRRRVAEVA
jgi:hypothetical protein